MSEPAIRDAILAQTEARGATKSICPSEVARALEPEDWQKLMPREARIDIPRKGKPVDPEAEIRGVIRLRIRE